MLKVNEIFHSIQGESTHAGQPTVFVRLTYCNLRCSYCDTEYAFNEGVDLSVDEVIDKVGKYDCKLVEVTGGEPLVQKESLELMEKLCDNGYEVMLETSGSLPVNDVDKRVKIIMDLKCPSSKMEGKNDYSNLDILKPDDEIKFVIGDKEDYDWAKSIIEKHELAGKHEILFSPVYSQIEPQTLVEWILEDKLKVRFQLQLHKFIWNPMTRGV